MCEYATFRQLLNMAHPFVLISLLLFLDIQTSAENFLCWNSGLPQWYNNSTHECKNGMTVDRVVTLPQTPPHTSTRRPEQILTRPPRKPKPLASGRRPNDAGPNRRPILTSNMLNCTLSFQPGRGLRKECCGGFKTYLPDFDTCCERNLQEAVVHKGKPAKRHVCCLDYHSNLTEVYRRGSKDVKCIHPSQNDDLWRKAKKMRRMVKNDCEDVRDFKYAYAIRVIKLVESKRTHIKSCYNATLVKYPWKKPGKRTTFSKCIPVDRYSPRRRLNKRTFAVLSDTDFGSHKHTGSVSDFYLNYHMKEDVIFKGPKKWRKFLKSFKKYRRDCQKVLKKKM